MEDNKEHKLDSFARKQIQELELEKTSKGFTNSVMDAISALETKSSFAYQPLISKKVWLAAVAVIVAIVFIPFQKQEGGLLEKVVWPTDITTLDVDAMVVRETTHRYSRLSFHRAMVGRRLPILQTACGLTYLAFCPQNERSNILTILAERDEPEYQLAREPQELDKILQHIREKGYGENNQSWQQENKIAAIAVPIHDEDRLLGCLNLVYIAKAMSLDKAAENYLADLQDVAKQIESGVSENTIRFGYPLQQ